MLQRTFLACVLFFLHSLSITADELQSPITPPSYPSRPHRIAIIGAGPGGSSASYHLRKFSQTSTGAEDVPVEISVFDSNPYIGGRTTTVNALDDPRYPVELGASIFVEINHILYNATRDFGLASTNKIYESPRAEDAKYELGIWDGEQFVFKSERDDDEDRSSWRGWWDIAKLLWRYGLAPIRTRSATRKAVGEFLKFYDDPVFPFTSIQEAVDATGLAEYTGVSGKEVLGKAGVGDLFAREIIQASTRVNYASNLGSIHGLETLVCMAIEGAMAVEGGNWQIFDQMVATSADRVFVNATVTDVVKDDETGTFTLKTAADKEQQQQHLDSPSSFDSVILAAPFQFANITFTPSLLASPEKIPYVDLHVTLFTSPHRLAPSFFKLTSQSDVPASVLTTLSPDLSDQLGSQRGVDAVGPPGFWSISTLRELHPASDGVFCSPQEPCNHNTTDTSEEDTQYLYKIFSPAPLTAAFLCSLLDFPYTPSEDSERSLASLSKADIPWLVEKHWHSYPYELPRSTFEPFTLGDGEGLYYLNGMESFISTMETAALAGMNVARLVVDRLHSEACGT